MPYITQVRDLNPYPPSLPSSILLLPETHPARRYEEHKRTLWGREYTFLCLIGLIPAVEACKSRPDRRLPPAPQPPGRLPAPAVRAQHSPLSSAPTLTSPPALPAAPGPLPPSFDIPELRPAPLAVIPFVRAVKRVAEVTAEPSEAAWKRVFGSKPRRVLAAVPETRNNTPMAPSTPLKDDLCLVPIGSEDAVPTVRGIIEEYYEERDYEQTDDKDERTPVYLSPKLVGSAMKSARTSNANDPTVTSSVPQVPPKAKQLLGSPTNTSDWYLFKRPEQSPHHSHSHSRGNSVNSLRHSASSRVANFLTPTKSKKPSTSSTTHSHANMVKDTPAAAMRANQVQGPSPLKQSTTLSPISVRNDMSAQSSPEQQAVVGASPNKSTRKSDVLPAKSMFSPKKSVVSPKKSIISPKKEDFSLKRTLSNALTPKHKRDEGPPVPEKDTPPESRLSANITNVAGRPSDAYSGNAFDAALDDDDDEPRNRSRETMVVSASDECSPVKEVPSGVVRFHHGPHSIYKGHQATFEVDSDTFREIEEEFQKPPIPTNMLYSPAPDLGVWDYVKNIVEEPETPDYCMDGLLPGGLLPATTYQPPELEKKRQAKREIYSPVSPSIYSNHDGADVFRSDSYNTAVQEFKATTPVPPNSLASSPAFKAQEKKHHGYGMGYVDTTKMLPVPHMDPIQYIGTVADNTYVYKPEDHEFRRNGGCETPIITHDFAIAGAQQQKLTVPRNSAPDLRVTPDKPCTFNGGSYEHPSAVPPPLRRTSGDSSSPSLRERYLEKDGQGGLGINVSEVGSFKDDGTTMGIDGDADDERSRESELLRTPISNVFASLWSPRIKTERERKEKDILVRSVKNMNNRISELHSENVERLAYMSNKMDRTIQSDFQVQNTLANLRESVDATGAAFVQFGLDDQKVQLIADKVIAALRPDLVKTVEQSNTNTERILARLDKCHDDMAKELDSLKKKSRRYHDRLVDLDSRLIWSTTHQDQEGGPREYVDMTDDYTDDTC